MFLKSVAKKADNYERYLEKKSETRQKRSYDCREKDSGSKIRTQLKNTHTYSNILHSNNFVKEMVKELDYKCNIRLNGEKRMLNKE